VAQAAVARVSPPRAAEVAQFPAASPHCYYFASRLPTSTCCWERTDATRKMKTQVQLGNLPAASKKEDTGHDGTASPGNGCGLATNPRALLPRPRGPSTADRRRGTACAAGGPPQCAARTSGHPSILRPPVGPTPGPLSGDRARPGRGDSEGDTGRPYVRPGLLPAPHTWFPPPHPRPPGAP
jgi:hypothetical protein